MENNYDFWESLQMRSRLLSSAKDLQAKPGSALAAPTWPSASLGAPGDQV
jgi:hypothetical protein